MKKMDAAILCLTATVLLVFCSYSYGEPPAKLAISFAVPFNHWAPRKGVNLTLFPDECAGCCLTGSFEPGLDAVLISKKGACMAKTAERCTWANSYHEPNEGTKLSGTGKCFTAWAAEKQMLGSFYIAVVGAAPAAVRVVSLKDDKPPVPKKMELKARKLAVRHIEKPRETSDGTGYPVTISDAQPATVRTENVTLLTFQLQVAFDREKGPIPWEPGPTVALMNGEVFLLDGACTYGKPIFFSVNERLHVTYGATVGCCGCGNWYSFVYELSSETPRKVYSNSSFAD